MKLYELTGQYNQLWNMVDEEADLQMIEDTLQGIEGDIQDKVENIVKLMKSIEVDETGLKAEEERLHSRRQALQNRRESIKKYLEGNLIATGIDKVKTAVFTVNIQNNPPSVNITNEVALREWAKPHPEYWIVKEPELSKKALLEDLKAGVEIPGAEKVQTKSVRIR